MLPTPRGILFLLLAAPLMAIATWQPLFEWLAWGYLGVGILVFGLDWRFSGTVQRFDVRRIHEPRLSLGAENPIRLEIHNRGLRPVTFQVRDEAPEQFQIETRILEGQVNPRETWRGLYHVRPLRRGDYHFGDLHLRWRSPLGLLLRQGRIPAAGPVKVFPNLLDVRRYDLLLRRNRLQEMGLRHSRIFGEGTEFERMREYLPDDEFRRINWKASARRRRPVTMEYQTERSQNVIALIDCGRMMQSPVADIAKLDYVVNASLFLSYVATAKGDRVGLLTFGDRVMHFLSPKQGRGQFYRMLEVLYAVEPQPVEPDYSRAMAYLALKQRRRALVILFTDLTSGSGINSLVAQVSLLARSNLLLVVTISDPDVYSAARQKPQTSQSVYERAAAAQLLDERRVTLETLQRRGVLTLDVPANQLSIAVINRYLELKGRMQL
ncbi:MAG: DUF58 domain-containing protein [Anaerolineales bacterium]|jgi:uncharacterized protein (DUF58 family)|nr:DUF58 domain-containing protein [Anaerolineales bacterium]